MGELSPAERRIWADVDRCRVGAALIDARQDTTDARVVGLEFRGVARLSLEPRSDDRADRLVEGHEVTGVCKALDIGIGASSS